MALTYGRYLRLDQLLGAQQPLSAGPEHDEMLFIVIHQVYELWFKQMLHETAYLQQGLEERDTHHALGTLKRMLTILKTLVSQIDILETMTPMSFGVFRSRLDSASGFESLQFRRFEFALGHKRRSALLHYPEGSEERLVLEQSFEARTLWDSFLRYLDGQGVRVPEAALARREGARTGFGRHGDRAAPDLPGERPRESGVRAARRPRRGPAGVEIPPREDGGAHHR